MNTQIYKFFYLSTITVFAVSKFSYENIFILTHDEQTERRISTSLLLKTRI